MTAQMSDEFRFEGEKYSLVGRKGVGLYTPQDFGLVPRMASTACHRGYIMYYDCIGGHLVLDKMHVNSKEAHSINGVEPIPGDHNMLSPEIREKLPEHLKDWKLFKFTYEGMKLKTRFTGSLLMAKDFIDSMYVHMGFQRPIAYRRALELQIQDGDIIVVNDLSSKMEALRLKNRYRDAQPDSQSTEDIHDWIEKTFSLDYDFD